MLRLVRLLCLSTVFAFSTSTLAWSQETAEDSVEYDFEEDVVKGNTKSPEELYIKSFKNTKAGGLITIRKDFQKEIVKSAEGI